MTDDIYAVVLGRYVPPSKPRIRECRLCRLVKLHGRTVPYCQDCWREYQPLRNATRKYEAKFTRPRIDGKRVRIPRR